MAEVQVFNSFDRAALKGDLFGGITAAIVALPLALAFGVSSGVGAVAGLYGAICVGLFAALFGGTPSQISGPTGPMTVVMAAVFTDLVAASPESGPILAFTVVMMSGVFQMLFGLCRLGKYITLVPFPVISGFMSGIGVIIISLQLAPLLGAPANSSVVQSLLALPAQLLDANAYALLLGGAALVLLFFWPAKFSKVLPSPLVVLIAGTLISVAIIPPDALQTVGYIPSALPSLQLPQFDPELLLQMCQAALMLAALGSVDSLLTSLVADNMTKSHHDSDRELVGQGIGNLVAGLLGGLPGAGATMRTVVNIRAGGQTALSGIVHALVLLALVLGAGAWAESIPHAVLAAILIKVGLDIVDWNFLKRLHRAPLFVVALMLIVFGLTVFVDLITAVLVGVFLANIITVKRLADTQLEAIKVIGIPEPDQTVLNLRECELMHNAQGQILLYHFSGPISYGAAKGLGQILRQAEGYRVLVLDFSAVPMIDVSTAMAIEEIILDCQQEARDVYVIGTNDTVHNVLSRMQILQLLPDFCLCDHREHALELAYSRLSSEMPEKATTL